MATQILFFLMAALAACDGFLTLMAARSNEAIFAGYFLLLIAAVLFSALALIIKCDELKKILSRRK